MFQEMFFVFKLNKPDPSRPMAPVSGLEEEEHKQTLDHALELIMSSTDDGRVRYAYDGVNGFEYTLIRLNHALGDDSEPQLKDELINGSLKGKCDLLFSANFPCFNEDNKLPGALVMDMDMTSVQIEGIDEIARCLGVFDEVAAITHDAMHGKLDFSQSLRKRVALLKDGDAKEILAKVKAIMTETNGLGDLLTHCNKLKKNYDFKTCIASGGFHELICAIEEKYGLDHIEANRLAVDADGKFTGNVSGPIIDGKAKAALVRKLKTDMHIPQPRIIVLGDGANDLLMMKEGGLGIAYHAKPKVQLQARNMLNIGDLSAVKALLMLKAQCPF